MNDELLKRLQGVEKELGALAAHEHANVSEFMRDPTTTSGDLIVLHGTDTTNYAASSLGAVATASSHNAGWHEGLAIDGNDSTFWASYNESPVGTWIYIDMGFPVTIGRFRIKQDTSDIIYKIQRSADHLAWTDVYQSTTFDTEQTGTFTAATARYWRFLGVSATVPAWNIFTIELYSPPGVHTLVPLHAVANVGYVLGIGADGFPAYQAASTPAAHNQAASTIDVTDAADYFTGTQVEAILAEMAAGWAKLARANTFTAGQTIAGASDIIQEIVRAYSSQTANIQEWQNSAAGALAYITPSGGAVFNETGDAAGDVRAESDTEANMLFLDSSADILYLGGTTDSAKVAKGGVITYAGAAKRHLSLRPHLYAGCVGGVAKPTFVTYGANAGYSFPIYSSDNEELFFRESLPGRWDGASDITGYLVCALAGAEDVNDDFAFQFSWANKATDAGVIASATTDVTVPQNVETGRAAAYSIYKLAFTIDWDGPATDAAAGDYFGGRIRRVASGGTEVAGEIILLDFYMTYVIDKIFKA